MAGIMFILEIIMKNRYLESITKSLDELNQRLLPQHVSNNIWTKAVKQDLYDLGNNLGFSAFATVPNCSEWLYDITWLQNNSDGQVTDSIAVFESEWDLGKYSIDYDFQKLLLARSDIKVMIFNQKGGGQKDKILESFIDQIKAFRKSSNGEIYLFSCWSWETQEFEHKVYTV